MEKIFGLYQGDKLLFHGTKKEISEETRLTLGTLKRYSSRKYLEKHKNDNVLKLIEVGVRK